MCQKLTLTPCSVASDNTVYVSFSGVVSDRFNVMDGQCCCLCVRDGTIIEGHLNNDKHLKVVFCNECGLQIVNKVKL